MYWEKERQDYVNKINSLEYFIDELKSKIDKHESNKQSFIDSVVKDLTSEIDGRFKSKYLSN